MSDLIHIRISERYEYYRIINTGEKSCIEQTGLSWAARGLHTYLMTRGEHWKIHINELLNRASEGRRSLENIIKELKRTGYLAIKQERNAQGRFQTVWEVYDQAPLLSGASKKTQKPTTPKKTKLEPHTHLRGAVYDSMVDGTAAHEQLPINDIPIDEIPKEGVIAPLLSATTSGRRQILSQFRSWIRDHGQLIHARVFGEKTTFPKDAATLDRIHELLEGAGFSWEELTRRYDRYLQLKEPALQKRGYPFAWFLDRFNTLTQETTHDTQPKVFEVVR